MLDGLRTTTARTFWKDPLVATSSTRPSPEHEKRAACSGLFCGVSEPSVLAMTMSSSGPLQTTWTAIRGAVGRRLPPTPPPDEPEEPNELWKCQPTGTLGAAGMLDVALGPSWTAPTPLVCGSAIVTAIAPTTTMRTAVRAA